jgi:hypothetical protein
MEILLCMKGHYGRSLLILSTWLVTRINEALRYLAFLHNDMTFKIHGERSGVLGAIQCFSEHCLLAFWAFRVYKIDEVGDDKETGRNLASLLRYLPLLRIMFDICVSV